MDKTMTSHRRTFLKQLGLGTAIAFWVPAFRYARGAQITNADRLPRSAPEEQGVSSAGILAFLDAVAASKHEFHSFLMLRHGHVIAEGWWSPYRASANHMLYSLSKSFTSTAVGFAVTEGRLKAEDKVTHFFPDDLPEKVSENLATLRVKHLLTMSVGHAHDSTGPIREQENWVRAFLALPIQNPPGTAFLYNSGASYMLSAIVQKVTGQKVLDYLSPRLFEPLGITGMTWETCPRGINTGGWGLSIQTEGLARFGQFYLQKGVWNQKQLLPATWIAEATTFKIQQPAPDLERMKRQSDWHQGYCYQFWRCRHKAFRGDGAFGQFTIVMPEQDAVVVITSETPDMQGELNLVWDHLLPAMKEGALATDAPLQSSLKQRLSTLALLPPRAQGSSPVASKVSGKQFNLKKNSLQADNISFEFQETGCVFSLTDDKGIYPVRCGIERWIEGETAMPGTPPTLTYSTTGLGTKVAASGTWKDDNTFEMTWRYYETPHHDTVTCRFQGDNVRVEFLNSITRMSSSHQERRPALEGLCADL